VVAVVVGEVSLPLPSSTKQVVEQASDEGFRRGMVGLRRIPCKHGFLDARYRSQRSDGPWLLRGYAVPHTAHALHATTRLAAARATTSSPDWRL
jgi:hypothetical protein